MLAKIVQSKCVVSSAMEIDISMEINVNPLSCSSAHFSILQLAELVGMLWLCR